jgi:DNA-binding HxlR family transcriptional regulator
MAGTLRPKGSRISGSALGERRRLGWEPEVSGRNDPDARAGQIMARVRGVIDPRGTDGLTSTQNRLFEEIAIAVSEWGQNRDDPIIRMAGHVGNFWRNGVLGVLQTGRYRPSAILRLLHAINPNNPISYRMLTLNLRLLERDGLVEREMIGFELNHVEYGLTPLGYQLAEQLMNLVRWIAANAAEVAEASARFDAAERS